MGTKVEVRSDKGQMVEATRTKDWPERKERSEKPHMS